MASLTVSFVRHFAKLGLLSQLTAILDALIDAIIYSTEGLFSPSFRFMVESRLNNDGEKCYTSQGLLKHL